MLDGATASGPVAEHVHRLRFLDLYLDRSPILRARAMVTGYYLQSAPRFIPGFSAGPICPESSTTRGDTIRSSRSGASAITRLVIGVFVFAS